MKRRESAWTRTTSGIEPGCSPSATTGSRRSGAATAAVEVSARVMKSIEVEVNLRIPRMKVPSLDERGYPIDNSLIRFTKLITVPAIPKPGEMLQLTKSDGSTFDCEVTRADWSDDRALFILGCKYAKRSISPEECNAL